MSRWLTGVVILATGIIIVISTYRFDKKFIQEGMTPVKAALYASGIFVILVGLAGLKMIEAARGSIFGYLYLNDIFFAIASASN